MAARYRRPCARLEQRRIRRPALTLPRNEGVFNAKRLSDKLPDRRRVLDAAVDPQFVQSARDAELRFRAEIALEYLAVVAGRFHRRDRPGRRKAQLFAEVAFGPDEAPDLGLLRLQGVIDRLGADAELFGVDQGEVHPFDDIEPGHVILAYRWAERLLGDDVGEDDVIVGFGEFGAERIEAGNIIGHYVAAAGLIGFLQFVDSRRYDQVHGHMVGLEKILDVELGRCAGLYADFAAIELEGAVDALRLWHEETLAVIIVHAGEDEAEFDLASHGPSRIARQDVDLLRFQRVETFVGRKRRETYFRRVAERRGRQSATKIDIEPRPSAAGVGAGKSGHALADAADQRVALAHILQRAGECGRKARCGEAN